MLWVKLVVLLVGLCPARAWWSKWSKEQKKATSSSGECGELPVVNGLDASAFGAAMASSGGAVLAGVSNESVVAQLLGRALGLSDEMIAKIEVDPAVGFGLARISKSGDDAVVAKAGPGLAVWTNGKWRASSSEETSFKTLAYTGVDRRGPLPEFLEENVFQKYGEASSASNAKDCLSVDAKALRIRGRLNGDAGSKLAGVPLKPCDFNDFDSFLRAGCRAAVDATVGNVNIGLDPPLQMAEFADCDPSKGARAFDGNGTRLTSLKDALNLVNYWADSPNSEAADVWFVLSGTHFVWPAFEAGHITTTSVLSSRKVTVKTLSLKPGVFELSNFLESSEASEVVEQNRPKIKPSEVGLVGRTGDKTRTSSNSWDTSSATARLLIERAFRLLKIDPNPQLEDGLQVLHYEPSQWYKPHVDYFTASNGGGNGVSADAFSNAVPLERNGTNRFATVFLYLGDCPAGGETAFPLSTSHESYQGGRLVHAGTEKTPGFIRDSDADWICNDTSEALRVPPTTAKAVLFYSQRGDSSLDPFSLHGSCPVLEGEKWAANLWVWNRPRDAIDKAKASAKQTIDQQFQVTFLNTDNGNGVDLFWRQADTPDAPLVWLANIRPGSNTNMNTYHGHIFVAKSDANEKKTIGTFVVDRKITTISIPAPRDDAITDIPHPQKPSPPDLLVGTTI